MARSPSIHGTTILDVRPRGHAALLGDDQVALGRTLAPIATDQDSSRYIP